MGDNTFPKLHNSMWPGLVGKGEDEPPISLDKMLDMTQAAEVDGVKFDGVDLFLADPHTSIDADDDAIKTLAENVGGRSSLATCRRWLCNGPRRRTHSVFGCSPQVMWHHGPST